MVPLTPEVISAMTEASTLVHGYEQAVKNPARLRRILWQEAHHATLAETTMPAQRDEWHARALIFKAAVRRLVA